MKLIFPLTAVLLASVGSALAADYPAKQVTIVVPSSAGGITDIAARMASEKLGALWKHQVIVDNRPGGGGSIGVGVAMRAPKDGYTLLMTTNGEIAVNPLIYKNIKYDTFKEFIPIAQMTGNPMVLVANASTPFTSYQQVIDAAKKDPGKITYASPGTGTWNHFAGEWLQLETGTKLLHVPYKGGGPAGTAAAGGDTQLGLLGISSALPHMSSGRLRPLAFTGIKRSTFEPKWPTIAELGVPGYNAASIVGLFAIEGVDPGIISKVEKDVLTVMQDPDVIKRFTALGIEADGQPGAEFLKRLKTDRSLAEKIVKAADITVN